MGNPVSNGFSEFCELFQQINWTQEGVMRTSDLQPAHQKMINILS